MQPARMSGWLMTVTTFLGGMAGPEQDRVEPVYACMWRVFSLSFFCEYYCDCYCLFRVFFLSLSLSVENLAYGDSLAGSGAERALSLGNSGRKSPKVFQLQFGLEYSFTHEKL